TISASPSSHSRTAAVTQHIGARLACHDIEVDSLQVRDLPAEDLLSARCDSPAIQRALAQVAAARAVVVASPVYKASYSGVLKVFLDLLPTAGLAGKVALPILTGGTNAHQLALDYALRPLLSVLGATHLVSGLFILDSHLERQPDGSVRLDDVVTPRLDSVVAELVASLRPSPARPR
ncbi:MAG TPA: NADPH-dependent FMN reductase, partial [Polyangia bacterium]|nr:NADPH-dependent FMN reductase [Polyangia bacterium]